MENNITVSYLNNITFYVGENAEECANAVENRNYDFSDAYFGDLNITSNYSTYWSNYPHEVFVETSTNYYNIGDILNATISYMKKFDKFDNSNIDVTVEGNTLNMNYNFENDLEQKYNNSYIIPTRDLMNIFKNVNEMIFNKKAYYKNKVELNNVSYLKREYNYQLKDVTYLSFDEIEGGVEVINEYNFYKDFVDFKYEELSYELSYEGLYYDTFIDDNGQTIYVPNGLTYIGFNTYYSYKVSNVNMLNDKIYQSLFDNSTKFDENDKLKSYMLSDLDTKLKFTLGTYSLGNKNIYAYFNYDSADNNWYNNKISLLVDTSKLNINDNIATIKPIEDSQFNIFVNEHDDLLENNVSVSNEYILKFANQEQIDNLDDNDYLNIVNPSKLNSLDLSGIAHAIKVIDLCPTYDKKINCDNSFETNWVEELNENLEELIIGDPEKQNIPLEDIVGISNFIHLKTLSIANCNQLNRNFDISKLVELKEFNANNSNINSFVPAVGIDLDYVKLPNGLLTLSLKNNTIDVFDYEPNATLVNLTLENVQGLNTQSFVKTWIDKLDRSYVANNLSVLHSGIINNTNLTGINWDNYNINDLLKLQYVGLNKFSGSIDVIGSGEDHTLNRKEYLSILDFIEKLDKPEMAISYNIKDDIFIKKCNIEYVYTLIRNGVVIDTKTFTLPQNYQNQNISNYTDYNIIALNNVGGNSLLDFIENLNNNELEISYDDTNKWYYVDLNTKIYTDSTIMSNDTNYTYNKGDILLYKGSTLIFANHNIQTTKKFVKLGTFDLFSALIPDIDENTAKQLKLKFK